MTDRGLDTVRLVTDLDRIRSFLRWTQEATSTRMPPWRFGTALFNDGFPSRWDSNFLRVERTVGDATPAELIADADRLFAGFRHREFVVEDDAVGGRLAAGFVELGYEADRLAIMALVRDADHEPPNVVVEEVDVEEVRPLVVQTNLLGHGGMTRESAEMLAEFRRVLVDRLGARFFVAKVEREAAGYCELYQRDGLAQIEDVNTLPAYRGHGVARAFMSAAIAAATEGGADLAFVIADADDWPRQLYAKLGFDEVGRFRQFTKPPPGETYR
jgi:N-acetylglutamate synthase-like GNAT family acetyltransferase